jgi:hypothetical protein
MNTETKEQEDKKIPTKEEIIAYLQEQIEVKKVQLELQELNTSLAVNKAEELKALAFIAQLTSPPSEKEEEEEPKARTLKKDK